MEHSPFTRPRTGRVDDDVQSTDDINHRSDHIAHRYLLGHIHWDYAKARGISRSHGSLSYICNRNSRDLTR